MNFICISNYNNDVSWIKNYPNDYIIYDRSDDDSYVTGLKYKKTPNIGYNIYDMFRFIIENYNNLPEFTTFCKGNIFPRHISKEYFEKMMNNKYFNCLFDHTLHKEGNFNIFSSEGNYCELNNNWYMFDGKPYRYFSSYNDFIKYFFKNPVLPIYITFCPGANYVVPKQNILKYPVKFYELLIELLSHSKLAAESHLLERALYTIWNCNYDLNDNILEKL
jgi:hypothetical protein